MVWVNGGGTVMLEMLLSGSKPGQVAFTEPGEYEWVVPSDVTSISAVCVGAGGPSRGVGSSKSTGGNGGSLRYINDFPVIPGETLNITVPTSSINSSSASIKRGALVAVEAASGNQSPGFYGTPHGAGPQGGHVGGGNGGLVTLVSNVPVDTGNGGGGAGGYSGDGGNAGEWRSSNASNFYNPTSGQGGGGGGGARVSQNVAPAAYMGGPGGGVGIYGEGGSGASGGSGATGNPGRGGSGGTDGVINNTSSPIPTGGSFGGGAGGLRQDITWLGLRFGGPGAVRIIWPGNLRQFPSTRTLDE